MVSARAGYEEMFPGDCGKWKMEAFKDISSKYENDVLIDVNSDIYQFDLFRRFEY